MKKKFLFVLIAILLSGFFVVGCATEGKIGEIGTQKGNIAPDISLYDLNGKEVRLSDFRGQVVMLNFWATWCGPCESEMPTMEAIYKKYKDSGFVILAVDVGDSEVKVKRYIKEHNLTFPVLLDWSQAIAGDFAIIGFPTTFIIDQNGVIRAVVVGERN